MPISPGSIPHRHRRDRQRGPPSWSANRHRQVPPPVRERQPESADCRRPSHPIGNLPILASKRADQSRLNPAPPQATPPTRSARTGPPTDTAKLLRQAESATQRVPTAGEHLTRSVACRSSHRSVPISRGPNPHRHRPTPPTRCVKQVRQTGPPTDTAKLLRQSESANRESANCR